MLISAVPNNTVPGSLFGGVPPPAGSDSCGSFRAWPEGLASQARPPPKKAAMARRNTVPYFSNTQARLHPNNTVRHFRKVTATILLSQAQPSLLRRRARTSWGAGCVPLRCQPGAAEEESEGSAALIHPSPRYQQSLNPPSCRCVGGHRRRFLPGRSNSPSLVIRHSSAHLAGRTAIMKKILLPASARFVYRGSPGRPGRPPQRR